MSEEHPTAWELLIRQHRPAEPEVPEEKEHTERKWPDDFRGVGVNVKWPKRDNKKDLHQGQVIDP